MIGVEGQYVFQFSLESLKDFISEENLTVFQLIEEAGNILPVFRLEFVSYDDTLLTKIHEGNDLKVQFGKSLDDKDHLVDTNLIITKVSSERIGDSMRRYTLLGLYSAPEYLSENKMSISDKVSGFEAITKVAKIHFDLDIQVGTSQDKQFWIQPNVPDKIFINQIWQHCKIGESVPLVGINVEGKFILTDLKKVAGESPKWTVANENGDIQPDTGIEFVSNSGFLNHVFGYGMTGLQNNIEKGDFSELEIEPMKPILAQASGLDRKASIVSKRFGNIIPNVESTHDTYWESQRKNLANLAIFSSHKVKFSFERNFKKISVLDMMMIKDDSTEDRKISIEALSGNYVTTKVVRTLSSKNYITIIEACRECLSDIRGNIR